MNKTLKKILVVLLLIAVVGAVVGYKMWNKPKRDVAEEKGIEVTSAQLVKDYQDNESTANTKYLDKAIQVTGTVSEVKNNQEGKQTVMLASDDLMTGVFCTMRESANLTQGSAVTIKGICSGMLSDVRLRDAIVVK